MTTFLNIFDFLSHTSNVRRFVIRDDLEIIVININLSKIYNFVKIVRVQYIFDSILNHFIFL